VGSLEIERRLLRLTRPIATAHVSAILPKYDVRRRLDLLFSQPGIQHPAADECYDNDLVKHRRPAVGTRPGLQFPAADRARRAGTVEETHWIVLAI
jgi:hypothetical protein